MGKLTKKNRLLEYVRQAEMSATVLMCVLGCGPHQVRAKNGSRSGAQQLNQTATARHCSNRELRGSGANKSHQFHYCVCIGCIGSIMPLLLLGGCLPPGVLDLFFFLPPFLLVSLVFNGTQCTGLTCPACDRPAVRSCSSVMQVCCFSFGGVRSREGAKRIVIELGVQCACIQPDGGRQCGRHEIRN